MSTGSGWQPLSKPSAPAARNIHLTLSPFGRLARTHALAASGDGAIALALAGSIFFNISPSAARTSIALYLVLTIAPLPSSRRCWDRSSIASRAGDGAW